MKKKTVVIHSGGMDSSICLAQSIVEFGRENVTSLSFSYQQRHSHELERAKKICADWSVEHELIDLSALQQLTSNALMDTHTTIVHHVEEAPNTLVVGRNGLMARLGAIYAQFHGIQSITMGVIEVEESNSGYRDCSRRYMDIKEALLRIDLDDSKFSIRTPLVKMTKKETLELAHRLGVLDYLLVETITCYEGIPEGGCRVCPACELRNQGIKEFCLDNPSYVMPYAL